MSAGDMDYGATQDDTAGQGTVVDHAFVRMTIFVVLLSCVITALLWIAWLSFKRWRRSRIQDTQIEMGRWSGG